MSMRAKTIALVVLIVFVTTAANFFSGLYLSYGSVEKTMEQDLMFAIGVANNLVGKEIDLLKSEATVVAERLSEAETEEELLQAMKEQLNVFSDVSALALIDREGVIASYSVPVHEHTLPPEHDKLLETVYDGNIVLSSPFYCPVRGEFVMNVYVPTEQGRILAVTVPGLTFSDMLSEHTLWKTGDIFLIDETGTVVGAADSQAVLAMENYIEGGSADSSRTGGSTNESGDLIREMLANEEGVYRYHIEGKEYICAYSNIEDPLLDWRIAVSAPVDESPQASVLGGYIYVAILFLIIGVIAAVFLARLITRPFNDIEVKNRELEEYNKLIEAQAASIRQEHERARLMLDATPMACRLWDKDFNMLDCNEEVLKFFEINNKQEYISQFIRFSPEYQPNGEKSAEGLKALVKKAYEEGRCVCDWTHCKLDGTLIPAELTMVRIPYNGDSAVAGYSRDLREEKKMLAEIEHRGELLNVGNRVSFILFDVTESRKIEAVLSESMALLGQCIDVDYIHIIENEMVGKERYFAFKYAWNAHENDDALCVSDKKFPYSIDPGWERKFLLGEYMNGAAEQLPRAVRDFYASFALEEIKSVLAIPVFVGEEFWGIVSFASCNGGYVFDEDAISVLRSMSLMMATAVNRNKQNLRIREINNRMRLLTDATPVGFNLWDQNFHNIETNDTAVRIFGLESKEEYLKRFFELSPLHQPDGRHSKAKAIEMIKKAFNDGYAQFEWMHQKLDGTQMPMEVTLVRITYMGDYVVAGYTRDLRDYKRMMGEIEQRDNVLQVVNRAAEVLLRTGTNSFTGVLKRCMGMMASAIGADRMYLFRNVRKNKKLYCTQLYEWSDNVPSLQDGNITANVSYSDKIPEMEKDLSQGLCVRSLVSDMRASARAWFYVQDTLAILIIPVFIENKFWGFVGFDNCHSEQMFTEIEESIMRSGSLLIVNALLRNEYLLNIRDTSAKLQVAVADAKEANSAKSNFLAHMSHEIRTPLNAVIGLSELMLSEGRMEQEADVNLEKIYSAGSTILSIVNDILDISKIEAGKFEENPVQYDTPSLINDTVTLNIVRIGEKPIAFNLYVDENLPGALYGDDLRVKQIFNNLLSNAFKYTNAGVVEWRLSFERNKDDIWLVSSVRDTGVGIRPEDVQKLFLDYNQVDTRANRRTDGTGLGLAITKSLVELMGGTIAVESKYGEGTTFHVRLRQRLVSGAPIGREVAENLMKLHYTLSKRTQSTGLARINLSYAHVLVVDDIETNLDVVKGMMKPYAVKIDCVTGGRQAVELIKKEKPRYNAIFMDHMMPDMDGVEATRIIREEIGTDYAKKIPIIALTANAIVGSEKMFLDKGFQAFISKPIDVMKLDSVLRRWVRDKKLEKEVLPVAAGGELPKNGDGNMKEGSPLLEKVIIDGVDVQAGVRHFGGRDAVFADVLRSYAKNTKPLVKRLDSYLTKGDLKNYGVTVHGIKGSSYGIFAQQAGKAAEALEHFAEAGDLDAVKNGHAAFKKMEETLLGCIDRALVELDATAERPVAAAPDPEILTELRGACEAYDMDRVDVAMERLEAFRYERGGELVAWLRKQVDDMAFEKIVENEWPTG